MTLMTRKEVAKYLKIGLNSVDGLINKRNFHGKIKIGNRVLIDKDELDKYLESLKSKF